MEYKSYSPSVKVLGGVIMAFVAAFYQPELAKKILAKTRP